MLLGRRAESIAVAESVVEGVSPTPAIIRVMPLSWTATIVTSVREKIAQARNCLCFRLRLTVESGGGGVSVRRSFSRSCFVCVDRGGAGAQRSRM